MYAHPQHIPQPPHSAGKPFSGFRSRIDPEQIPYPIESAEADQELWNGTTYSTLPGTHVPLSSTDYLAVDQGNATPRFIRLTTWNIPSTSDLAHACQIPIAAIIQPFADTDPREEGVPLVHSGESGPARCKQCRGYMNPWCSWTAGGSKWRCNLCEHETEAASDYFCNLDANGFRLDHLQRPELNKGTVDFVVSREYWSPYPSPRIAPSYTSAEPPPPPSATRRPVPMHVVLAIDVSVGACKSGLIQASCLAVKEALFGGTAPDGKLVEPCFPVGCKVAVITYDDVLHFYDLSPGRSQADMLVVADIEDVFCPLRDNMFTDPFASRSILETLLDTLPMRFENTHIGSAAFGAAGRGALAALARHGGHVLLFHSLGTMLTPAETKDADTTWRELGEECAEAGVGVSLFVSSAFGGDLMSIAPLPTLTGGLLHYFPRFDVARDSESVHTRLRGCLTRIKGYNCAVRVRCSSGLRVQSYYGGLSSSNASSLSPGVLSADHAFSTVFTHTSTLNERHYAFIQCAVLYTSVGGERRVRVVNLAVQVAGLAGNVFRFADLDAVVCLFAKDSISTMQVHALENIRGELTERSAAILLAYRKNCAASTSPSQLILPETFKLLPLYVLALQKSKALKEINVSADLRHYHAHRLLTMSVRTTMRYLYPRLLALHDLTEDIAVLPEEPFTESLPPVQQIRLPSLMRASHLLMEAHGVYLIDNEEMQILWIGADVSPQLLIDLFGVESVHDLDTRNPHLPELATLISAQVRNILAQRRAENGGLAPKLVFSRQNLDAVEIEFSDMLVEDMNNGAMSYIDYLCFVHKQINAALTNGTSITSGGGGFGLRGAPW